MTLLLAACATLGTVVADGEVLLPPLLPDVATLEPDTGTCDPGPWTLACPSCAAPWAVTVTIDCAAEGASGWEVLVLEAAGRSRDELSLNEDWNLYQEN